MQKRTQTVLTMAVALVTATAMLIGGFSGVTQTAQASSHREAPLISLDPSADNTDVYAFVAANAPNTVTVLANFIPGESPAGGPNFYKFDDNVLYQIRFDNNGDGKLDLAIQYRFRTVVGNGDSFLYNGDFDGNGEGTINSLSDPDFNVKQFMDVTALIRQGDPANPTFATFQLGSNLPTPPVNVGPRSTPNYEANLAQPSITTLGNGIKLFAGQREEGFYVDLGSIFDLVGLRPFNNAHIAPMPVSNGVDALAGANVHTIAIQIPTQLLTTNGQLPTSATDTNGIIGIYSTASRPGTRVLNTNGTVTQTGDCGTAANPNPGGNTQAPSTGCVQVSRQGNPLFNELFIPMGTSPTVAENDKDLYNATLPSTDNTRIDFVRGTAARPVEPVNLINLLYNPPVLDAPTSGRIDLVRVYLTGVPAGTATAGGPSPAGTRFPFVADPNDMAAGLGSAPAEYLRLNTGVPATAPGMENRIGFAAGDFAGFPNGRRLGDDVVDITLRAAAGILLPGNACSNGSTMVSCNQSPNNILGDGVNQNDKPFLTTFPYLASPYDGYSDPYRGRECASNTTSPCPSPSPTPRP